MGSPVFSEGLTRSRFVRMTTFRRSGAGVHTPFGALHQDGRIYCWTMARSGKVKRIRRDSRVEVAPCIRRGTPTGPTVPGSARVLAGAEAERMAAAFDALWKRQFGLMWRVSGQIERWRGVRRVVIEIVPAGP